MFLLGIALVILPVLNTFRPAFGQTHETSTRIRENCTQIRWLSLDSKQSHNCSMTLRDLADQVSGQNSLQVSIMNGTFHLSFPLIFQDFQNLTFEGFSENMTVIQCNTSDISGAGLVFKNSSNVSIANLSVRNCNVLHNSTSYKLNSEANLLFRSAVFFEQIRDLRLISVSTIHSNGVGVTMYNVTGTVQLDFCTFKNNFRHRNESGVLVGGGGLYIESSIDSESEQLDTTGLLNYSTYTIHNCTFEQNQASKDLSYLKHDQFYTFGQGGGMFICLRGPASKQLFNISSCCFRNNSADWGGGIHIMLLDSSQENNILIHHSHMVSNLAKAGGGGMVVYLNSTNSCQVKNNSITCVGCKFTENVAKNQGGGALVLSELVSADDDDDQHCRHNNSLLYESCIFCQNKASYSSAVDITTRVTISEDFGIIPTFSNSKFIENKATHVLEEINGTTAMKYRQGRAAFMAVMSKVIFQNFVVFNENNGTAMYCFASKILLKSGLKATFENNSGINGGAIALIFSFLSVGKNSCLIFKQNTAHKKGGAIYSRSVGEHELHHKIPALTCFLQCPGCEPFDAKGNNITLEFTNNSAKSRDSINNGNSIYATSLSSCVTKNVIKTNLSDILESIAKFEFVESNLTREVTTSAMDFKLTEEPELNFIPGKEQSLPVVATDTFGHELQSSYEVFLVKKDCTNNAITIDVAFESLPNNKIKLYGDPGAKCRLGIVRKGYWLLYVTFKVSLGGCPPGYVLMNSSDSDLDSPKKECVCARYLTEFYRGLEICNSTNFHSYVLHGYWAGYESDNASDCNLRTAFCPRTFCSYNSSAPTSTSLLQYPSPVIANKTLLDTFICQRGRTGMLCGTCIEGHSVYFHSPAYLCKRNNYCSYGLLLYIISELLPLTVIFAIILIFNISFTSGTLNGFLFYAQIIDMLSTGSLDHPEYYKSWIFEAMKSSVFVYRFFNLNFFTLDSLSFCLWKGASTLDIIAMKYLTIAYAFFLVFSVFLIMNLCAYLNFKRFSRRISLKQSVIHGISTLLTICFAQTVQVSFYIFTPEYVYQRGDKHVSTRVRFNGEIKFFGAKHLKYAFPALASTIILAIIPTFYLLWYPLGIKILNKCRLSETKLVKLLERILFINRLKPLFDSFQGCYRDNFRFFAGLYFLHRTLFIAIYSISSGLTQFYLFAGILLLVVLFLHSLSQPYKNPTHNALDTLLFTDLALVNGLSLYIHIRSLQPLYFTSVTVSETVLMILIPLPLVCLALYTTFKLTVKSKLCQSVFKRGNSSLEDDLPPLVMDDERKHCDTEYSDFELTDPTSSIKVEN